MAKKRTKADRLERQTEQLGKRVDRHPDEIEKKLSTLAPKSDELTVLIPIENQIQLRAYELYEQRGRTDGHELDDWLQAEREIKGHAGEHGSGIASASPQERLLGRRGLSSALVPELLKPYDAN
jgi:hypothetical protein